MTDERRVELLVRVLPLREWAVNRECARLYPALWERLYAHRFPIRPEPLFGFSYLIAPRRREPRTHAS